MTVSKGILHEASPVSGESFDDFAVDYDAALNQGLHATGEQKEYFIRRRLRWLRHQLAANSFEVSRLLDFGCGCGDSCELMFDELQIQTYTGIDVSRESLRVATERHGGICRSFSNVVALSDVGRFDLAYCNGVFHHILPEDRPMAMHRIFKALRPGGIFAYWENNPWNLGTRWVMSQIPFDRDAITLTPVESKQLLREAGFEIVSTSFLFIFPKSLSWLRSLEAPLAKLPLGGQYQILARRQCE